MSFEFPQAADLAVSPEVGDKIQRRSLIIGVVAAVLCVVGALLNPSQFLRSYLLGFMFWMGISLGCMAILMLQHLSGGRWGLVVRRQLESAARNIPLMALFFLPLLLGVRQLYPWANQAMLQGNEALRHAVEHKRLYLNWPFFGLRAVVYFAGWSAIAYTLHRWSLMEDREESREVRRAIRGRFQGLSGAGLIFYGMTITFASIDWVMSLDPQWASTIYGILILGGQGLSALAFVIGITTILARHQPMKDVMKPQFYQDLGTMMLAFVMLWTYFSFSQFMIIWSGNLVDEIPWYLRRLRGGWQAVALLLLLFHFVLPFLLLLSRDIKRHSRTLVVVAVMLLVARYVDLFWLIAPNFQDSRAHLSADWMDVAAPVAIGGLWLARFFRNLKQQPLLPLHDPQLAEVLEAEHVRA